MPTIQHDVCANCPRMCPVDRASGRTGRCGIGGLPRVAQVLAHFGEEPPICGPGGTGTVFFSGCNLRCVFCQNWQISRSAGAGDEMSVRELAAAYASLERKGCSHLELVSPTPHLPWALDALLEARREHGLSLPAVVNSNAYLPVETVELYASHCQVMLADLKLVDEALGASLLGAADYGEKACRAVERSAELFGPLMLDDDGLATGGCIVRHLVLPGLPDETRRVLDFLADLPVTLSLMAQYHPSGGVEPAEWKDLPGELGRCLETDEYFAAVEYAGRLAMDSIIIQEPGSGASFLPDFDEDEPFGP